MSSTDAHLQILRSTATFGSSSLFNVLVGIVRSKVIAVLLGSSGIAVVGMLGTTLQAGALVAGMGLRTSGVRELAAAHGDDRVLARVRKALLMAHVALGLAGAAAIGACSATLSMLVFGTPAYRLEMACVGIGLFLSLIASSRTALLQGTRDIRSLARASAIGTGLGALFSILAVSLLGAGGIWLYVLCTPAASVLATGWYVARRVPALTVVVPMPQLLTAWRAMFLLGAAFMVTSSLPLVAKLFVQSQIARQYGLDTAGQYQAAWTVSIQYLGFVLASMAADYYPHLAQKAGDSVATNRLVNDQARIGILLAGPLILALGASAHYLLPLLYTEGFSAGAGLLRWQVLGDVFKIAGWPIGFVLLANADRRLFLLTQSCWSVAYCGLAVLLLPAWGLEGAGIAFAATCGVGFALNCLLVGRKYGVQLERANGLLLGWLLASGIAIVAASAAGPFVALCLGLVLSCVTAGYSLARLWLLLSRRRIEQHRLLRFLDRFLDR